MMTLKAITSAKKKQLDRFLEDAVKKVDVSDLDNETAQRIIESGNKLPEAIKMALRILGRKPDDTRVTQAKRLWDLGFGTALGFKSDDFEGYLATIPEVPESLREHNPELPLLTLVDPRVGLQKTRELAKVADYGVDNLVPYDERHATPTVPHWIRAHDGRKNHSKTPRDCRALCTGKLLAGTAEVGLALFIHHKNVAVKDEHVMDLPGSVRRGDRDGCAYLGVWVGGPGLRGHRLVGLADSSCGTVVFSRE